MSLQKFIMRVTVILTTTLIVRTVKFMKVLDSVARTEAARNAHRILLVKPLGKLKPEKTFGNKIKISASRTTALTWRGGLLAPMTRRAMLAGA
jgi:hypothetical protein